MSTGKTNKVYTNKLTVDKHACFKGEAIFCDDIKVKGSICGDLDITGDLCVGGNIQQCNGTYDVIICGVGTAGAVAMRRISDGNPSLSILGLVTGENLNEDPIVKYPFSVSDPVDFGSLNLFQSLTGSSRHTDPIVNYNWLNYNMSRNTINIYAGKGQGGASNHWFLAHTRPSPGFHDYVANTYAGAYAADWNGAVCNQIYKAMETYIGVPSPNRGTTGPFFVLQSPVPADPPYGPAYAHTAAALKATSLAAADTTAPVQTDYNDNLELCVGNGAYQQGIYIDPSSPSGVSRSSSTVAYLGSDFLSTNGFSTIGRNTRVMYNAYVNKVLFDGDNNAVGVEVIINGEKKVYKANKKIIICAGAMRSPGILERSGIGSGIILSNLGIPQVVENPNVGENFQTHSAPGSMHTVAPTAYVPDNLYAYLKSVATTPYPYDRSLTYCSNFPIGQAYFQVFNSFGGNYMLYKQLGIPLDGSNTYANFAELCQPTSRGSVHLFDTCVDSIPKWVWRLNSPEDLYAGRVYYQHMKRLEYNLNNNITNPGTAAIGFSLKFPSPAQFAGYTGAPGAPSILFTASIAGTVMTVTAVASGTLESTMSVLEGATFNTGPATTVVQGTMINEQVFPLLLGETAGGIGRYNVNIPQTVGSMSMHGDFLDIAAATINVVQAHPCGTCKMGDRITQQGVVNGQLHVYGVQKLMVADNSIWPQIPNTNTHLAAMLVGYRAADICLATI